MSVEKLKSAGKKNYRVFSRPYIFNVGVYGSTGIENSSRSVGKKCKVQKMTQYENGGFGLVGQIK